VKRDLSFRFRGLVRRASLLRGMPRRPNAQKQRKPVVPKIFMLELLTQRKFVKQRATITQISRKLSKTETWYFRFRFRRLVRSASLLRKDASPRRPQTKPVARPQTAHKLQMPTLTSTNRPQTSKICHAHFIATNRPQTSKNVHMNANITETIKYREMGSQI